jgi:predicted transcriptional regulator
MSNKELVIDLVQRLPDEATLMEIAKEIEFVAGVREGFAQLDRGEGVPLEEVKKQISSWTTK